MTSSPLSVSPAHRDATAEEVLVVGASLVDGAAVVRGGAASAFPALAGDLAAIGFTGKKDELVRLPAPAGSSAAGLAVVGLGAAETDADALRYAAGVAARRLSGSSALLLDLAPTSGEELDALLEGAGLGSYDYAEQRGTGSRSGDDESGPHAIEVDRGDLDGAVVDEALRHAGATVDAVNLVRDLVNEPALDLYPESYADRVLQLTADLPLDVRVWGLDELREEGFGGIVGVGQGSSRPPRLVRVDYSPAGASAHLALVGKGITFDTGGLSLKPPVSMIGMKYDMAGSATVLAATVAAARLGLPVRITAWLCLAENMPSGTAIRPGDVLTIRGGRTVEVLNTDAEGRLVLADGIVAAGEENPDVIVDVATLTGAAIVALGNRYVATMGDDEVVGQLVEAARQTGETLWPMPLPGELRPMLASDIADIANVKPGNTAGGMLVAGVFLKEFVGDREDGTPIPWAHLDIAGAAHNKEGAYGYTGKGPTGATVRALLRFAELYTSA